MEKYQFSSKPRRKSMRQGWRKLMVDTNLKQKFPSGENFNIVMNVNCLNHVKNDLACKNKWGSLVGDFKKIYDYMVNTKHN
jgi:hypothetical protein